VHRAAISVELKYQHSRPLRETRVILDNCCMTDAIDQVAHENIVFRQLIVTVL
jgi:hypothetical protein